MLFACNAISGQIRKDTMQGREHLVAPVIAIAGDSVLNEEYVPFEEVASGFGSWDNRPVTLGHPRRGDDYVSANDPRTLEKYEVGRLFRTHLEGDKLKGELWIDISLAQGSADGRELLRRLEAGERVEVSTGYWRDLEEVRGNYNGRDYYGIARNLKPDHLAMLLRERGACSWQDGCGAPRVNQETFRAPESARNNAKRVLRWREEHPDEIRGMTRVGWARANQLASNEPLSLETVCRMAAFARHEQNAEVAAEFRSTPWRDAGYVAWLGWGGTTGINWAQRICESRRDNVRANILSEARTPSYNGTTDSEWSAPDLEDFNFGVDTVAELTDEQRAQIASGSLLGDPDGETFRDLSFFPVVEPGGDLNRNALMAVISGRGQQADIPAETYASADAVARRLLEEEFDMESESENVNVNALLRVLRFLGLGGNHAVTANQGDGDSDMEEDDMQVQDFLALGEKHGVRFNESEIAALSELPYQTVNKITALIEALVDAGAQMPDDSDGPMSEQPVDNCAQLNAVIEQAGGPEAASEIISNVLEQRAEQRNEWIEVIHANVELEDSEVESMSDGALQKLAETLMANQRKADYGARSVPKSVDKAQGVHEYKRPGREESE